jgi:hypothetical protein
MKKLVYGIGINDANYMVCQKINGKPQLCPYYRTWHSMLERCYSAKYQARHPTYIGCTVCEEWHSFMAFRVWMIKQDWQGKQLDKDLLVAGNRVYSSDTCLFVSSQINTLLSYGGQFQGNWPIGVCWDIENKKFRAACNINGSRKQLGRFTDPQAAHRVWQTCKIKAIHEAAASQEDARLVAALNRIAAKVQSDFDLNIETKNYGGIA